MLGRNIRLILSCLLLSLAVGWGMLGNSMGSRQIKQSSSQHLQSLSPASMQPATSMDNNVLEPVANEPEPQPSPQPAPEPESTLSTWQGESQPIVSPPNQIPVWSRIPTEEPIVFLTIDDGWIKSPEAKSWLLDHNLPFSLFLDNADASGDYEYFRSLQNAGMTIQNHTMTHTDLTTLTLEQQQAEICGAADQFGNVFGSRPTLLRPPYGAFNELTRQAAAACGMKAIVNWHAKANGGSMQFQEDNTHLLPGDIVLMHFRPEFLQDMEAFTNQAAKDNLQVGRLEDWIQ